MKLFWSYPETDEQESISHHCLAVAEQTARFAAVFGCEEQGRLIGMLHDFGKYSERFQEAVGAVNHAAPGAALLYLLFGNKLHAVGNPALPLAMAIYGHHTHLPDTKIYHILLQLIEGDEDVRDEDGCPFSIYGRGELRQAFIQMDRETAGNMPGMTLPQNLFPAELHYMTAWMLYTRMLYSCLIDADALVQEGENQCSTEPPTSPSTPEHAADRTVLQAACEEAADRQPGFFSLTAPAGSDRTLALLTFARRHLQQFPDGRIFLILPDDALPELYLSLCHQMEPACRFYAADGLEQCFPERWDAPLTVMRARDFWETLFAFEHTPCRKLHRLAGSIILLDGARPDPAAVRLSLETLRTLTARYHCSAVLAAETPFETAYPVGLRWSPYQIGPKPEARESDVPIRWELRRAISPARLAARMAALPSCCTILNRTKHARMLYQLLQQKTDVPPEELFFLSSDLCSIHRQQILQQLHHRLAAGQPCRLVATPCVEWGAELAFEQVFRAAAPLESIQQAAGCCIPGGQLTVFRLATNNVCRTMTERRGMEALLAAFEQPWASNELPLSALAPVYARRLYQSADLFQKSIDAAVKQADFAGLGLLFRHSEKRVRLIVSLEGQSNLYREITRRAAIEGMSPVLARLAAPLALEIDREELALYPCCPIPLADDPTLESGWWLLTDPAAYTATGLL